ncbi:MAG: ribosomal-protein-alanine N-acetyltransferase [Pseudomonadota bacterium]|jgi:ribosomal-protein-alanine N-acetyltransferase
MTPGSPSSLPIVRSGPGAGTSIASRRMTPDDLEAVMAVEEAVYPFPWTRGNFRDSIDAGYDCWVFESGAGLVGYAIVMWLPDEVHLLNISVDGKRQGLGLGRAILRALCADAAIRGAQSMLLEVRPSNATARALYASESFELVGIRKRYYPAGPDAREDALVMRRSLARG